MGEGDLYPAAIEVSIVFFVSACAGSTYFFIWILKVMKNNFEV